jgi:hypothetical protein
MEYIRLYKISQEAGAMTTAVLAAPPPAAPMFILSAVEGLFFARDFFRDYYVTINRPFSKIEKYDFR